MKKIVALALVAVMLTMALVSCGTKLSGTYELDALVAGVEYEFKGSKVTITPKVIIGGYGTPIEATYKIKDDKITITVKGDEDSEYAGTYDFEKGDDYIKIGGITYKKAD